MTKKAEPGQSVLDTFLEREPDTITLEEWKRREVKAKNFHPLIERIGAMY